MIFSIYAGFQFRIAWRDGGTWSYSPPAVKNKVVIRLKVGVIGADSYPCIDQLLANISRQY